jgi:hypothetical protein
MNENHFELRWSPHGAELATAETCFSGSVAITAIASHMDGFVIALASVQEGRLVNEVFFSRDPRNIRNGHRLYSGPHGVIAFLSYQGGILTSFTENEQPTVRSVRWSRFAIGGETIQWEDGNSLFSEDVRVRGTSPVIAMCGHRGGVLSSFLFVAGARNVHGVTFSPNGANLGGATVVQSGSSAVIALAAIDGHVLASNVFVEGNPIRHAVQIIEDATQPLTGPLHSDGYSKVTAILPYQNGHLMAYMDVAGNLHNHAVEYTEGAATSGNGTVVFSSTKRMISMISFQDGVLFALSPVDIWSFVASGFILTEDLRKTEWSGRGDQWSGWFEMSSLPKAGYEVYRAAFQLIGDRRCGQWAHCEHIGPGPKFRFEMQGHNEIRVCDVIVRVGDGEFPISVEVVLEQDRGQSTGHLRTFYLPAGNIDFDALGIHLRGPSSSLTWNR